MSYEQLYIPFEKRKQHGLVCPLFFLQTEDSSQIGEYPDLVKLGTWASRAGFTLIQLLPIFDTGDQASPYSALSCFALNPIFLSLKHLKGINTQSADFKALYAKTKTPFFDYQTVYHLKIKILKDYIPSLELQNDPLFLDFYKKNPWLKTYGAYCAYKQTTNQAPYKWTVDCNEVIKNYPKEVFFHQAMQFFCYRQFAKAQAEVEAMGLSIMGDIPILLSPYSVEMWTHKHLFDFELSVGAPPDQYSDKGQSWGFPMMRFFSNPQACADFWLLRLTHAARYFSLCRIDHFVGFFRFWVLSKNKKARDGFFFPADNESALSSGSKILEYMFKHSPITPIAEDLGSIPDYVKTYIKTYKICGTKVIRWERYWEGDGSFIPLDKYPFYSMSTLSTHDSTFMFDEWGLDPEGSQKLAQALGIAYSSVYSPLLQEQILKKTHHASSLFIINMIQEYLYLHPKFKDSLTRVNDPNNQNAPNWTAKMALPIEELLNDEGFSQKIHALFYD